MLKTNKYINFCDLMSFSWKSVISNIVSIIMMWVLLIAVIIALCIFTIPVFQQLEPGVNGEQIKDVSAFLKIFVPLYIGMGVFNIVIWIGFIKVGLAFCDCRVPHVLTIFNFFGCFWRFFATGILYYLIVLAGTVLFIVPGIIWSIKYSMAFFFVVDKKLGPIDALKASARATDGMMWHWFGLLFLCNLVYFLGGLCLYVGLIIAIPMLITMAALAYRQLSAQTPELAQFGIVTMPQEMPVPGR